MAVNDEIPKGRITLTYRTEIDGEPVPEELPFRVLVAGDLGSTKDKSQDLDVRELRNMKGDNFAQVMKDMGIKLDMVIPNKINPDEESTRVNLDIDSMDAFSPDEVAKQIPQVKSLLLMKELLQEIESNVANKKELMQLLNKLYSNPELLEKMRAKLKPLEGYRIPQKKEAVVAETKIEEVSNE